MKHSSSSGFTLIEILVVLSLIIILSLMVFAPYSYYLNKSKIRYTDNEISQVIYKAKNMALNGAKNIYGNISVAVYFDSGEGNNQSVLIKSYPYDIDSNQISGTGEIMTEVQLQPGIQIDSFQEKQKGIIFFRGVTGSGIVFAGDETLSEIIEDEIEIKYSYKGADKGGLRGDLRYYPATQIVDY
ncbi:MAG: prepilin-type N-terminal cleavage/methylation domain-containing protein [Candidatus Gracilibacteria bacterium]|nr:prepilin-type N-terminal cleavage/methylation domain-containing protein [Candidatus Gracilibacteria bacterium]